MGRDTHQLFSAALKEMQQARVRKPAAPETPAEQGFVLFYLLLKFVCFSCPQKYMWDSFFIIYNAQ